MHRERLELEAQLKAAEAQQVIICALLLIISFTRLSFPLLWCSAVTNRYLIQRQHLSVCASLFPKSHPPCNIPSILCCRAIVFRFEFTRPQTLKFAPWSETASGIFSNEPC